MTRKVKGKTITETFATPAELHKHNAKWRPITAFVNWRKSCWRSTRGSAVPPVEQGYPQRKKNGGNIQQEWLAR